MGGREVGGLNNQLVAHMDFSPPIEPRIVVSASPRIAESRLKAVDLFNEVKAAK